MSGFEDLLGEFGGFGGIGDLLGGLPKKPHDWDYSKTTPECRRCKIKWEHNASPEDIKKFLTPTCPLTTLPRKKA